MLTCMVCAIYISVDKSCRFIHTFSLSFRWVPINKRTESSPDWDWIICRLVNVEEKRQLLVLYHISFFVTGATRAFRIWSLARTAETCQYIACCQCQVIIRNGIELDYLEYLFAALEVWISKCWMLACMFPRHFPKFSARSLYNRWLYQMDFILRGYLFLHELQLSKTHVKYLIVDNIFANNVSWLIEKPIHLVSAKAGSLYPLPFILYINYSVEVCYSLKCFDEYQPDATGGTFLAVDGKIHLMCVLCNWSDKLRWK